MVEARFPDSLMPQILKVLMRHGRWFSALVAIVAFIPFAAAPRAAPPGQRARLRVKAEPPPRGGANPPPPLPALRRIGRL